MTNHQIHSTELKREFNRLFQSNPEHIFFCPGRINLIGEHIDYNGGQVLPCAISMGTYLAVSKNNDKRFRFHCLNFPETADLQLQSSYSKTGPEWFNYPLGVIDRFLQEGHDLSGLNLLFYGNLPIGAGLSSSASIEVLTGFAIASLFGLKTDRKEIALLAKDAENHFIGVNCGIMDQFAVAMGQKDHAILLNCDQLAYEYIPFKTGSYSLLIINTNKQRSLADSKYNERFTECGAVLKLLKQELPIQHLCEAGLAEWETSRYLVNNPVLEKRATHVISENQRVKDAVIALQTGDMDIFGKLLYASHHSLRYDYEVSGRELDTIVDFCKTYPDCVGARMTGAGFGGCAIALVKTNKTEDFSERLIDHYTGQIGYAPGIFAAEVSAGVGELQITN